MVRLPRSFALFPVMVALAGAVWTPELAAQASLPQEMAPTGNPSWTFKCEQEWIVDSIGRDLAEILSFVHDAKAKAGHGEAPEFHLKVTQKGKTYELTAKNAAGQAQHTVTLQHHLWAPENYTPWVHALMKEWKIYPVAVALAKSDDADLSTRFAQASEKEWIVECQRIDRLLAAQPLDPEAHEQAALALGWLGLEEAAGSFSDIRPTLSRMTAHLALARALRREPGRYATLAEVMQLCLLNLEAEALKKMESLPPNQAVWREALEIRCTGDWRKLPRPESASRLERREYVRALRRCRIPLPLEKLILNDGRQMAPVEWARVVNEGDATVQEGHVFAALALPQELDEAMQAWKALGGKVVDGNMPLEPLNDLPTRCVVASQKNSGARRLQVVSWGDLASFHQRHLIHALAAEHNFFANGLGAPDMVRKIDGLMKNQLSRLRLCCLIYRTDSQLKVTAFGPPEKGLELCEAHPEWVNLSKWESAAKVVGGVGYTNTTEHMQAWFDPPLAMGTPFGLEDRVEHHLKLLFAPASTWEELSKVAPYDYPILHASLNHGPKEENNVENMEKRYAGIMAYNSNAPREIAVTCGESEPDKCAKYLQKVCDVDPNVYLGLGAFLLEQKRPDDAAAAFQSAFELATDRVSMANASEWLVNYCYDHGRKKDALKIATAAGEVYSYLGLECLGNLMVRMQRWKEAEKAYQNILERYNGGTPLQNFYLLYRFKDPSFAAPFEKVKERLFPQGFKQVTLADFHGAPQYGAVFISDDSAVMAKYGLHKGDVIVALDGNKVDSVAHYQVARSLSEDPHMALIVWDGHTYREVATKLPERLFGGRLDDYRGASNPPGGGS